MIYLDNAATTRPSQRAVAQSQQFLNDGFYNPSALYGGGLAVHNELKTAREFILSKIAEPRAFELFFTSGGTEADNHAVLCGGKRGNVVVSQGEHSAVYQSAMELKNRGVEVRFASLNRDGSVEIDKLLSLVDEKTSLASFVHVNNETGAINDLARIAKGIKQKNPRCLVHSDGVQAFGKIPVRLPQEVDLYAISAHKIGGLKGVGALIKKKGVTVSPLLFGGGQENGVRSGTENVFGISCFYYATKEKFEGLEQDGARLRGYREKLFLLLDNQIFTRISPENGTPYILTVSAKGLRGEILQRLLEEKGVIVGTGSACSSKHPYSRVIQACGFEGDVLGGVLRLSFSSQTTEQEILACATALNETAQALKQRISR